MHRSYYQENQLPQSLLLHRYYNIILDNMTIAFDKPVIIDNNNNNSSILLLL